MLDGRHMLVSGLTWYSTVSPDVQSGDDSTARGRGGSSGLFHRQKRNHFDCKYNCRYLFVVIILNESD